MPFHRAAGILALTCAAIVRGAVLSASGEATELHSSSAATRVHNLVRSELISDFAEDKAIKPEVDDVTVQFKAAVHGVGLHGVPLEIARSIMIGIAALVFLLVLQFSTQRLSKVRNPETATPLQMAPSPEGFPITGQAPTAISAPDQTPLAPSPTPSDGFKRPQQSVLGWLLDKTVGPAVPVAKGKGKGKGKGKVKGKGKGSQAEAKASEAEHKPQLAHVPKKAKGAQPEAKAFEAEHKSQLAPVPKAPLAVMGARQSGAWQGEGGWAGSYKMSQEHSGQRAGNGVSARACDPWPWHALPSPEMLLSAGPTFHVNLKNALPDLLQTRGLVPAAQGSVALIALWNWPGERQRALVELCVRDTLANKRTFALHLARARLNHIAPRTFLSPGELQASLASQTPCLKRAGAGRGSFLALPKDVREGLWFLKHAGKDNNLGVTCFRGVGDLLKHWTSEVPGWERLHYVAQAEVQRPLLSHGFALHGPDKLPHKVTLRAYVLVLGTGRCFLHREMLLKTHPNPYDHDDPDQMQHVLCHVKYDGVGSHRGTQWSHYAEVWPQIGEMMAQCFGAFDGEPLQDEAVVDEAALWPWQRFFRRFWSFLAFVFSCLPLFRKPQGDLDEAESMKYALLGLDVIVDEDLRPWCLELNRSPTLNSEPRDPEGSKLKAEVVEDFCELLVDPLLKAAAKASRSKPLSSDWSWLEQWSAEHETSTLSPEPHRGFVELPWADGNAPGSIAATLAADLPMQEVSSASADGQAFRIQPDTVSDTESFPSVA